MFLLILRCFLSLLGHSSGIIDDFMFLETRIHMLVAFTSAKLKVVRSHVNVCDFLSTKRSASFE